MSQLLQTWDGAILLAIQSIRVAWVNPLVCFYTTLGNAGMVWIVLSILLLIPKSTRKMGVRSLTALAFGCLCTNIVLKQWIERPRPYTVVEGLASLLTVRDPNSFPSGHSTAAFAMGVACALTTKRRWVRVVAVGQAVLMALSRLYVGVHYPTDVLCGSLIGTGCAWLACTLWNRREAKQNQSE